tara:strand:+ start:16392 stop:16583 length:192 start_codon:yes stop_codon:yes gene_type:complete
MKLSHQAMGAVMLALQNSILEQSDIVPVLEDFNFQVTDAGDLIVSNPPKAKTIEQVEDKFQDA